MSITEQVKRELKDLGVTKAVGLEKINPHSVVKCADQLATPLALFQACMVPEGRAKSVEDCKCGTSQKKG